MNPAGFAAAIAGVTTPRRVGDIARAVISLLELLPHAERHAILDQVIRGIRPIEAPRGNDVLHCVIQWLPRGREWRIQEAKAAVYARTMADPKEVHNAVGYLTRRGKLRRLGYGRYWTVDTQSQE